MTESGVEAKGTSALCVSVRPHFTHGLFPTQRHPSITEEKILQLLLLTFKNEQMLIVYGFPTVI